MKCSDVKNFGMSRVVVCVKMSVDFSKTMVCKIMVNVTDRRVCAFPNRCGFVDYIINLSWDGLADHSVNSTFTRSLKLMGSATLDYWEYHIVGHNRKSNAL